jgi:hypothetical protein
MTDAQWYAFFVAASEVLGPGSRLAEKSQSWCAWITFEKLSVDAGYWTSGVPSREDIFATHIGDSGVWGQPFTFSQLAHIVVPRRFMCDEPPGPNWAYRERVQNLEGLSAKLHAAGVPHRVTELMLEIKCY